MLLARKVNLAKWQKHQGLSLQEIPADAITNDLRTKSNTLSFWECIDPSGTDDCPKDAALAIAASGQHIEGIDIIWFSSDVLEKSGQTLNHTAGDTPVTDMINRHVDACHLDGVRLLQIADQITGAIQSKKRHRFTKKQVETLLVEAVRQNRVNIIDLKTNVQEKVVVSISDS